MPPAGSLEAENFSENLEPFRKARGSKISEIFDAGGATKNLGDFWSRGPSPRFPRDLSLSLVACGAARRNGQTRDN